MNSGRTTIWLNGAFMPPDKASISPLDRGFLYGDGFFETIRSEEGTVLWLSMHTERLEASLSMFRIRLDPIPDWAAILNRLLRENGLSTGFGSIKIIVTRGVEPSPGLPVSEKPTVCITAGPYTPPSPRAYEKGWKLHVYKEGCAPSLARFKSLNYLYYLTAKQAALEAGCDMAMILDQGGFVTETCAGSLLARTDGQWWTPKSRLQLPGTTIRVLSAILEDAGSNVEPRSARPEDFYSAETVWTLNSLIGIMPVAEIDEHRVPNPARAEAAHWRTGLFRQT